MNTKQCTPRFTINATLYSKEKAQSVLESVNKYYKTMGLPYEAWINKYGELVTIKDDQRTADNIQTIVQPGTWMWPAHDAHHGHYWQTASDFDFENDYRDVGVPVGGCVAWSFDWLYALPVGSVVRVGEVVFLRHEPVRWRRTGALGACFTEEVWRRAKRVSDREVLHRGV